MKKGIFLLLGTNLGNRKEQLTVAKQLIEKQVGKILNSSSFYKTAAWGNTNQCDFYNQVIQVETSLPPEELLEKILQIETQMGRKRAEKWGPRLIDIDLLFYDKVIINSDRLVLPHPEIQARRFTLVPLAELQPDFIHPVLKKKIKILLLECQDDLPVELVE